MPPVKLDLRPMPDTCEIHDKVWFRTAYDRQGALQTAVWFDPVTEEHIGLVVNDASLVSKADKAKRLAEMTGREQWMCEFSVGYGKWHNHANMYVSIDREDFRRQVREPVRTSSRLFWFFKDRLVKVNGDEPFDEVRLTGCFHSYRIVRPLTKSGLALKSMAYEFGRFCVALGVIRSRSRRDGVSEEQPCSTTSTAA